ncbi:MAG: peptidyl-prolyl cis-trans isomerase [Trueperaceae bacterium]
MKFSKRTTTIILWAVSIGLLAGMVISFTPGLSLIGANTAARGPVEMTVNGQNIHQFDVQQARSNALFSAVTEGEVGADLQRLMVDQIVRQAVLQQAASRINVSGGEVRRAVNEFREERGVAGGRNDRAYQQLIANAGFTDQAFREYLREQIRLGKFEDQLVGDVTVSEEEVEAFFQANRTNYMTEEQILARQLVVDDLALAQRLRARALAGESFAELAREYSLDLADRDGAVGAASGETEPRPVGRPALATNVANAAFALRGVGTTDVVESNQRFFVVQVEGYLPAVPRPFDEVEETVRQDALDAKKGGIVEAELDRLREEAVITFPASSELSFNNPVVATVNGVEIRAVDVDAALYTNPQIQQSLSPQVADLIVGLFKPTVQSQVIDTEVAFQAADSLGVPFIGTRAGVAQSALNFVGRDATATEAELLAYYETNLALFTLPGEAFTRRVDFDDQDAATAFRQALLSGQGVEAAVGAGVLTDLGLLRPGEADLEVDTALFGTQAFEPLPDGVHDVSDVLVFRVPVEPDPEAEAAEGADGVEEADDDSVLREQFVVLVAERIPERVRAFEDVRSQVEASVLAQLRQAERADWLADRRSEADIVEFSVAGTEFPLNTDTFSVEPDDAVDEAGSATDEASEDASEDAGDSEQESDQ